MSTSPVQTTNNNPRIIFRLSGEEYEFLKIIARLHRDQGILKTDSIAELMRYGGRAYVLAYMDKKLKAEQEQQFQESEDIIDE